MQLSRLRGRKVCDAVIRKGKVWKGKNLVVRWLAGAPRHPHADPSVPAMYVGLFASAKLDKSAVKRNRMRRRCREALRTEMLSRTIPSPVQLLLCPRAASLDAPFDDIVKDIQSFLSTLPVFPTP